MKRLGLDPLMSKKKKGNPKNGKKTERGRRVDKVFHKQANSIETEGGAPA